MKDSSDDSKCPKCGGNNVSGRSGSITQWVVNCACATVSASEITGDQSPIEICLSCKKRIGGGRSGSLTQWIFRSDLCGCTSGGFIVSAGSGNKADSSAVTTDGASSVEQTETFVELEIDPDRFPVARYGPLSVLGSGGWGTVYLCYDRLLSKRVAIKSLTHLSADQLISFQGEAKAASRLNHPNVIQIMDFGVTEGGVPFMVMEFIKGNNLEKILEEEGTLNIAAALYIFTRVCEGLAEAHKQGIFHRDIKCSNVLVGALDNRAPQVRLIDFGVASFNLTAESNTVQGVTLVGTPAYMSPDQALGRPYDVRCEVYSIGCALFEALTGSTPFAAGETALETMNHHAHTPPPALSEANPNVQFPEKLEKIVARCLEKDPDRRYQKIADLINDLNAVASETIMVADTAHGAGKIGLKSGRSALFIVSLVVCGALACLSMFAFHASVHDEHATINQIADPPKEIKKRSKPKKIAPVFGAFGLPPGFRYQVDSDVERDLTDCWLATPSVTDEGVKALIGTPVRQLSLADNKNITNKGMETISTLRLKYLQLTRTNIGDSATSLIARLKTLEWLRMDHTKITDDGLKELRPLQNLKMLDLGGCGGVTDKGLDFVATGFPNLLGLDIGDTNVSPKGLHSIKKLKHITKLRLCERAADKEVADLVGLPLVALDLSSNAAISDEVLISIAKMKDLRVVELTGCMRITEGNVRKLEKKRPDMTVICNFLGTVVDDIYSQQLLEPPSKL